jgi:hypothetical protein
MEQYVFLLFLSFITLCVTSAKNDQDFIFSPEAQEVRDTLLNADNHHPKPPIIFLPGLASSRMVAWKSKQCTGPDIEIQEVIWLNLQKLIETLTFDKKCWLDCMKLEKNGTDPPDCKVRPDEGLSAVGELAPGIFSPSVTTLFTPFIRMLAQEFGYDSNTLLGAPYDWRISPMELEIRDSFFTTLKMKIEITVKRHKRPAIVVAHSMGNNIFLYFCDWLKINHFASTPDLYKKWMANHFYALIGFAAPLLGAPSALKSVVSGHAFGTPLSDKQTKELMLSFSSTNFLNPRSTLKLFEKKRKGFHYIPLNYDQPLVILRGLKTEEAKNSTSSEEKTKEDTKEKTEQEQSKNNSTETTQNEIKKDSFFAFPLESVENGTFFQEVGGMLDDPMISDKISELKRLYHEDPVQPLHQLYERPPIKHVIMIYGVDLPTEVGYIYRMPEKPNIPPASDSNDTSSASSTLSEPLEPVLEEILLEETIVQHRLVDERDNNNDGGDSSTTTESGTEPGTKKKIRYRDRIPLFFANKTLNEASEIIKRVIHTEVLERIANSVDKLVDNTAKREEAKSLTDYFDDLHLYDIKPDEEAYPPHKKTFFEALKERLLLQHQESSKKSDNEEKDKEEHDNEAAHSSFSSLNFANFHKLLKKTGLEKDDDTPTEVTNKQAEKITDKIDDKNEHLQDKSEHFFQSIQHVVEGVVGDGPLAIFRAQKEVAGNVLEQANIIDQPEKGSKNPPEPGPAAMKEAKRKPEEGKKRSPTTTDPSSSSSSSSIDDPLNCSETEMETEGEHKGRCRRFIESMQSKLQGVLGKESSSSSSSEEQQSPNNYIPSEEQINCTETEIITEGEQKGKCRRFIESVQSNFQRVLGKELSPSSEAEQSSNNSVNESETLSSNETKPVDCTETDKSNCRQFIESVQNKIRGVLGREEATSSEEKPMEETGKEETKIVDDKKNNILPDAAHNLLQKVGLEGEGAYLASEETEMDKPSSAPSAPQGEEATKIAEKEGGKISERIDEKNREDQPEQFLQSMSNKLMEAVLGPATQTISKAESEINENLMEESGVVSKPEEAKENPPEPMVKLNKTKTKTAEEEGEAPQEKSILSHAAHHKLLESRSGIFIVKPRSNPMSFILNSKNFYKENSQYDHSGDMTVPYISLSYVKTWLTESNDEEEKLSTIFIPSSSSILNSNYSLELLFSLISTGIEERPSNPSGDLLRLYEWFRVHNASTFPSMEIFSSEKPQGAFPCPSPVGSALGIGQSPVPLHQPTNDTTLIMEVSGGEHMEISKLSYIHYTIFEYLLPKMRDDLCLPTKSKANPCSFFND